MTKRLDPDVKALRLAVRGLDDSSSLKMLLTNLQYLWDRYIGHPNTTTTLNPWQKGQRDV